MKLKFFVTAVLTVFSAFAATPLLGQDVTVRRDAEATEAAIHPPTHLQGLTIRRNSSYRLDGVPLSRAEILERAALWPDVVAQIKKGVWLKWTAVGLGITGGSLIAAGVFGAYVAIVQGMTFYPAAHNTLVVAARLAGAGLAIGGVSIWLGVASVRSQKKAARLYNEYTGHADRADTFGHGAGLSLAPTGGGLGLQLRF